MKPPDPGDRQAPTPKLTTCPAHGYRRGSWTEGDRHNCLLLLEDGIQCASPPIPAQDNPWLTPLHCSATAIMSAPGSNLASTVDKLSRAKTKCRLSQCNLLHHSALLSAQLVADPSALELSQLLLSSQPSSSVQASKESIMRTHGVSRRGGPSSSRGRAGPSASPLVIPISSTSPSSPPPSPTRPAPNSSFQTSRYTFRSRLHQPIITFTTTIMVTEDAEEPIDPISSSTPSPEASLSQEADVNPPPSVMHMQEDSPRNVAVSGMPTVDETEIIACGPIQQNFGIMHMLTQAEESVRDEEEESLPAAPISAPARRSDPQSSGKCSFGSPGPNFFADFAHHYLGLLFSCFGLFPLLG